MGAGWVAGVTRARAMLAGRVGAAAARELAGAAQLREALRGLSATPYGRGLDVAAPLGEAQRSVSAALLWQWRVLAGWLPQEGVQALRLLASDFEIANTEGHLSLLRGRTGPAPYRLGALATAWRRLRETRSPAELRAGLAHSAWGDPGSDSTAAVSTGMRLSAAARTATQVPQAERWAAGRAALLAAREVHLGGRQLPDPALRWAARVLGEPALRAGTYDVFRARLRPAASWALADAATPAELWRAEIRWWLRAEQEGLELARRTRFDASPVVGTAVVLAADAWRVRAALVAADRGGRLEDFDALLV